MHFNSKVLHGQKREQRSARETDGKSPTKYGAVPALFHEPLSLQMIIAVYLRSLAFVDLWEHWATGRLWEVDPSL